MRMNFLLYWERRVRFFNMENKNCIVIFIYFSDSLSNLAAKKKQMTLYRRFFRSDNFTVWYNQHRDSGIEKLKGLYLNLLATCNVRKIVSGCETIQAIDFFMRIREHVEGLRENESQSELFQQLVKQQEAILSAAPAIRESLQHYVA